MGLVAVGLDDLDLPGARDPEGLPDHPGIEGVDLPQHLELDAERLDGFPELPRPLRPAPEAGDDRLHVLRSAMLQELQDASAGPADSVRIDEDHQPRLLFSHDILPSPG